MGSGRGVGLFVVGLFVCLYCGGWGVGGVGGGVGVKVIVYV